VGIYFRLLIEQE
jgi:hypothetical protein